MSLMKSGITRTAIISSAVAILLMVIGYLNLASTQKESAEAQELAVKGSNLFNQQQAPYIRDAQAAISALHDLESIVTTGTNYNDYARRLGDTGIAVRRFLREQPVDHYPPSQKDISAALTFYELAASDWRNKIDCQINQQADFESKFNEQLQRSWQHASECIAKAEGAITNNLEG